MILHDLILPSRINQQWKFSGIDHIDACSDKQHFLSYPYEINYSYNSRGFRDREWPDTLTDLKNAVWCIGDSFTVGLGSPLNHTWPRCLESVYNLRTINVSMDGASNEWIARITEKIVNQVDPKNIIIMWSYTHRRENIDHSLSDENRRMYSVTPSSDEDWENFLTCKKRVDAVTTAVQFAIPYFHTDLWEIRKTWELIRGADWPVDAPTSIKELNSLPCFILDELKNLHKCLDKIQTALNFQHLVTSQHNIILFEPLDKARDSHHFDLVTAEWVAKQAACHLA